MMSVPDTYTDMLDLHVDPVQDHPCERSLASVIRVYPWLNFKFRAV